MRVPRLLLCALLAVPLLTLKVAAQASEAAPAKAPAPHPAAHFQTFGNIAEVTSRDLQRRRTAASISNVAAAQARQAQVRETMLRLIGPLPDRTPLNPVILGESAVPGMRIQKILFDSQPGFHVTALLYLPDVTLRPDALPAVVMAPGHSPAGKAGDWFIAESFVRNGIAVLSYDPIGQGERLQYPDPRDPTKSLAERPTGEHGEASLQPILLGESIAKYFLWDGMRAIDYLETRGEIDPKRIGAFGCSGGGSMTALLGALDPRVAVTGTACYLTSFSTLLAGVGPQDGEQSTPGWIAAGLDFPDWVEAAAPRPYAIIATESDMFPFAGAQATEKEARTFYKVFNADANLAFLHGPGGHGNLRPILPAILKFFTDNLHAIAAAPVYDDQNPIMQPRPEQFQVTSTGQVSTFDTRAETVFSLNLKHAQTLPPRPAIANLDDLQRRVANLLGGGIRPLPTLPQSQDHGLSFRPPSPNAQEPDAALFLSEGFNVQVGPAGPSATPEADGYISRPVTVSREGNRLTAILLIPRDAPNPGLSLLLAASDSTLTQRQARLAELRKANRVILLLDPQPNSTDIEHPEIKAAVLGPWYLPGLSAELVGRTILGTRVQRTQLAIDYLGHLSLPHLPGIAAEALGPHQSLVLLHAAILETPPPTRSASVLRIASVSLSEQPRTYAEILADPFPKDVPQDLVPGVLRQYDVPDLLQAVGARLTVAQTTVVRPDNSRPPH